MEDYEINLILKFIGLIAFKKIIFNVKYKEVLLEYLDFFSKVKRIKYENSVII